MFLRRYNWNGGQFLWPARSWLWSSPTGTVVARKAVYRQLGWWDKETWECWFRSCASYFRLHGRVTLQAWYGDEIHIIECQFAQFRNLGLDEDCRLFRIESAGHIIEATSITRFGVLFQGYRCYRSMPAHRRWRWKFCQTSRNSVVRLFVSVNLRSVRYGVSGRTVTCQYDFSFPIIFIFNRRTK